LTVNIQAERVISAGTATTKAIDNMSLFWDILYLLKKTPWDTGITPPEIVAMINSGQVTIGRALDLGCGTGTNAIYLAQHGFDVTGIDVSMRAIALACRKARSSQQAIRFVRGDVTRMNRWAVAQSIDFAYDVGCFHSLPIAARQRYASALLEVTRPGAIYMLYGFDASAARRGVSADEVAARFAEGFLVQTVQRGGDRNGWPSAWYTLQRV
jgi:SAM-dependent methyltransferase